MCRFVGVFFLVGWDFVDVLLGVWGFFVYFLWGKVWVLLFGVFFQFIFKRQINDPFIPSYRKQQ